MKNLKSEQLLYKGNSLAYLLILFAGFISAYGNVVIMRDDSFVTNYLSGFYVIGTIINLLFLFYTAIQIKDYNKKWIKNGAIFGVTLIARIFVLPEGFIFNSNVKDSVYVLEVSTAMLTGIFSAVIAISLLYIGLFVANKKINDRDRFIEENDINMKELFN